ncbi:hypothetical protein AB28_1382 [Raoultella ornithinolytica 2-156-04_S1_C2]|nr:hypothetical protein AB00_1369 [Raoultella ornithinolytica 2-156-04_S1_C1]KDX15285.1 hypothetical protein AB28_1382 [Raoultella ornithinolytica 2-156-04_S1_C2]
MCNISSNNPRITWVIMNPYAVIDWRNKFIQVPHQLLEHYALTIEINVYF